MDNICTNSTCPKKNKPQGTISCVGGNGLVEMLHKELKKKENLLKSFIDEYEKLRFEHCSTVQEFASFKEVYKQLEQENDKLLLEKREYMLIQDQLVTALKSELDQWKTQYRNLEEKIPSSSDMRRKIENIENLLLSQNRNINDILYKFLDLQKKAKTCYCDNCTCTDLDSGDWDQMVKENRDLRDVARKLEDERDGVKKLLQEKTANLINCVCCLEGHQAQIVALSKNLKDIALERDKYREEALTAKIIQRRSSCGASTSTSCLNVRKRSILNASTSVGSLDILRKCRSTSTMDFDKKKKSALVSTCSLGNLKPPTKTTATNCICEPKKSTYCATNPVICICDKELVTLSVSPTGCLCAQTTSPTSCLCCPRNLALTAIPSKSCLCDQEVPEPTRKSMRSKTTSIGYGIDEPKCLNPCETTSTTCFDQKPQIPKKGFSVKTSTKSLCSLMNESTSACDLGPKISTVPRAISAICLECDHRSSTLCDKTTSCSQESKCASISTKTSTSDFVEPSKSNPATSRTTSISALCDMCVYDLEDKINELTTENEKLRLQLEKFVTSTAQLGVQTSALDTRSKRRCAKSRIPCLRRTTSSVLSTSPSYKKELEEKLSLCQEENRNYCQQIDVLRQSLQKLNEDYDACMNTCDVKYKQLSDLQEEKDRVISSLEKDLENCMCTQQKLAELEGHNKLLMQELAKITAQTNQQILDLERQIKELEQTNRERKSALDCACDELKKIQETVAMKCSKVTADNIAMLEEELARKTNLISNLECCLDKSNCVLDECEKIIIQLKTQNEQLKQGNQSLCQECKKRNDELTKINKALIEELNQLEETERNVDFLTSKFTELLEEVNLNKEILPLPNNIELCKCNPCKNCICKATNGGIYCLCNVDDNPIKVVPCAGFTEGSVQNVQTQKNAPVCLCKYKVPKSSPSETDTRPSKDFGKKRDKAVDSKTLCLCSYQIADYSSYPETDDEQTTDCSSYNSDASSSFQSTTYNSGTRSRSKNKNASDINRVQSAKRIPKSSSALQIAEGEDKGKDKSISFLINSRDLTSKNSVTHSLFENQMKCGKSCKISLSNKASDSLINLNSAKYTCPDCTVNSSTSTPNIGAKKTSQCPKRTEDPETQRRYTATCELLAKHNMKPNEHDEQCFCTGRLICKRKCNICKLRYELLKAGQSLSAVIDPTMSRPAGGKSIQQSDELEGQLKNLQNDVKTVLTNNNEAMGNVVALLNDAINKLKLMPDNEKDSKSMKDDVIESLTYLENSLSSKAKLGLDQQSKAGCDCCDCMTIIKKTFSQNSD